MYKSTRELPFKKYAPSEPTSPHWYSPASLQTLVFSYIANARNGGRDLPLGEFVREFRGLSRTSKAKAVCAELPAFKHLSDFEEDPDAVGELLARMREASKPPKPAALGFVGEDHFRAFFESIFYEKAYFVKPTWRLRMPQTIVPFRYASIRTRLGVGSPCDPVHDGFRSGAGAAIYESVPLGRGPSELAQSPRVRAFRALVVVRSYRVSLKPPPLPRSPSVGRCVAARRPPRRPKGGGAARRASWPPPPPPASWRSCRPALRSSGRGA